MWAIGVRCVELRVGIHYCSATFDKHFEILAELAGHVRDMIGVLIYEHQTSNSKPDRQSA